MQEETKKISFSQAMLIIVILMGTLITVVGILKIPTIIAFVLALTFIHIVCLFIGFKMSELNKAFFEGCKKAIFISVLLMTVGMVIASWIAAGVVPTLIYYGLKVLSPAYFLLGGFLLLCLVSLFIGSSFATAGTIGIALMSIGAGMGFSPALTAGMVVSGSIFGNKISPFADSTNLCISITGVSMVDHIKSMCWSVIPIFMASAAIYTWQGMDFAQGSLDYAKIEIIRATLEKNFVISPWLMLVPVFAVFLITKKLSPEIALTISALTAVFIAVLVQPFAAKDAFAYLANGFSIKTGVSQVDSLLNRGGISSMVMIAAQLFFIMGMCEILQYIGVVNIVLERVLKLVRGVGSLIATTLFLGLAVDALAGSQYLAVIVPGQMMKPVFEKAKIKLNVLSRTLEDSGTIFAYLLPWSISAIGLGAIIGVPVTDSYFYSYQLWFSPILALIYGFTNIAVWKEEGFSKDKINLAPALLNERQ